MSGFLSSLSCSVPFGCLLSLLLLAACARPTAPPEIKVPVEPLQAVSWQEVPGWQQEDLRPALEAFIVSCPSLKRKPSWQTVCTETLQVDAADRGAVRRFFENRFIPHRVHNSDGSTRGLITGYYVPDLQGSRTPDKNYRYPVLSIPDDLLVIDLGTLYPDLKGRRLRGRLDGRRVVPYWSRTILVRHRLLVKSYSGCRTRWSCSFCTFRDRAASLWRMANG